MTEVEAFLVTEGTEFADRTFKSTVNTYTRTGPVSDATTFPDSTGIETTWADFKIFVMGGFEIPGLDPETQALIDVLIDA